MTINNSHQTLNKKRKKENNENSLEKKLFFIAIIHFHYKIIAFLKIRKVNDNVIFCQAGSVKVVYVSSE